ncbi:MAG: glycosyltransferase family 2 protein [Acutalibacteraceae bacterium]
MNNQPLVSIVIPVYNGSNYLAEAIDSALAQTYQNIEILVVDDGSTDGGKTEEIARSYGEKIRYIKKENGGSSSALNEGIRNMRGDWFSWLSHDDLYYPDKVSCQIEALCALNLPDGEQYRHIFFSACDFIDAKGDYIKKAKSQDGERLLREIEAHPAGAYFIAQPTVYNFYGCGWLIHRKAFEEVGAFDEKLRLINDMDMLYRLYSGGFTVHYEPKALIMGRLHSGQISRSIGFSYHNAEQDMFWQRSLDYLEKNCRDNYEVFYRFGVNALDKTRRTEGERALALAGEIAPEKKRRLNVLVPLLNGKAQLRSLAKKVYMKLFMKKK